MTIHQSRTNHESSNHKSQKWFARFDVEPPVVELEGGRICRSLRGYRIDKKVTQGAVGQTSEVGPDDDVRNELPVGCGVGLKDRAGLDARPHVREARRAQP